MLPTIIIFVILATILTIRNIIEKNKMYIIYLICTFLFVVLFFRCLQDEKNVKIPITATNKIMTFTVEYKINGTDTIKTYSDTIYKLK